MAEHPLPTYVDFSILPGIHVFVMEEPMSDDTKRVSRSELYEQVWTTAITRLSRQYGLSDVGIAKICKRYNIPRPTRGYWARKAAGYKVKRDPLPPGDDVIIEIRPNRYARHPSYKKTASAASASEKRKVEKIVVPERLSSPHDLTRRTSEILIGRKANDEGLVEPLKRGCLDIKVSPSSLRRALRVMDTVIKTLEGRGHNVFLSDGETKMKIQNITLSFGITEKLVTKKKRPEEHDLSGSYRFGHNLFVSEHVPSGELSLTIHDTREVYAYGCQLNWNDGKKTKIENRVASFLEGLSLVADATINHARRLKEQEQERIERERRREEERKRRAELRQRYLEEQARVKGLFAEAENWKRSQVLREYIIEIEKREAEGTLPLSLETPFEEWLKWARDQADRLDPLSPSPPSVLDEECPPEESDTRRFW